jgi:hypothetical protein
MRTPPPVEFTSALGRAWRVALSLLVGVSVAVPLAWALPYVAARGGSREPDALLDGLASPAIQAALASWAGGVAFAAFWLSRKNAAANERTLRWDGQDWVLAGAALGGPDQRGDAALMFDLGPWMLVRFVPHAAAPGGFGAGTWLPLTLAGDPACWAALRGALWNWRGESRAGAGRP